MNAKLEAIAAEAAKNLVALIKEGEDKILKAWHSTVEEAELQEKEPRLKLSYSIAIDLDNDDAAYDLSWNVRTSLGMAGPIPDPGQPELPDLQTVTIKTGDHKITMSREEFANAAKRARETIARGES